MWSSVISLAAADFLLIIHTPALEHTIDPQMSGGQIQMPDLSSDLWMCQAGALHLWC